MKFFGKQTFIILHTIVTLILLGMLIFQLPAVKIPYYIWRLRHWENNLDDERFGESIPKLAVMGEALIDHLPELLDDKDHGIRVCGILVYHRMVYHSSILRITEKLNDLDPLVRKVAAGTLQDIYCSTSHVVSVLLDQLQDENKYVQEKVGIALIAICGPEFGTDFRACKSNEDKEMLIKKYKTRYQRVTE